MQVVTIPFDFPELSPAQQAAIVPICINSTDEEGAAIDWGWFEATARIQDPLRALARSWLDDVWRVSEITEAAVHSLWKKHRHRLGRCPSKRVFAAAKWEAKDRRAGTWQSRRRVLLGLDDLEAVIRDRVLADPQNYGRVYDNELYFKELGERLDAEGHGEVSEILKLIRDGCTWDEVGTKMRKQPDAARMHFHRWINKVLSSLSTNDSAQGA